MSKIQRAQKRHPVSRSPIQIDEFHIQKLLQLAVSSGQKNQINPNLFIQQDKQFGKPLNPSFQVKVPNMVPALKFRSHQAIQHIEQITINKDKLENQIFNQQAQINESLRGLSPTTANEVIPIAIDSVQMTASYHQKNWSAQQLLQKKRSSMALNLNQHDQEMKQILNRYMNTSNMLDIKGVKTLVKNYKQKKTQSKPVVAQAKELRQSKSLDKIMVEDSKTFEAIEKSSARFQTKIMRKSRIQRPPQRLSTVTHNQGIGDGNVDAYPFSPLLKMSDRDEDIHFSRGGWDQTAERYEERSIDDTVSLLEKSHSISQSNLRPINEDSNEQDGQAKSQSEVKKFKNPFEKAPIIRHQSQRSQQKGLPSDHSVGSAERFSDRLSEEVRNPLHSGALYSEERLLEEARARALQLANNYSPSSKNENGINPSLSLQKQKRQQSLSQITPAPKQNQPMIDEKIQESHEERSKLEADSIQQLVEETFNTVQPSQILQDLHQQRPSRVDTVLKQGLPTFREQSSRRISETNSHKSMSTLSKPSYLNARAAPSIQQSANQEPNRVKKNPRQQESQNRRPQHLKNTNKNQVFKTLSSQQKPIQTQEKKSNDHINHKLDIQTSKNDELIANLAIASQQLVKNLEKAKSPTAILNPRKLYPPSTGPLVNQDILNLQSIQFQNQNIMQHPILKHPRDSQGITDASSGPTAIPVEQFESNETQTDLARTGITMRRQDDEHTPGRSRSSIADAQAAGHIYRTIERHAELHVSKESKIESQNDTKIGARDSKPRKSKQTLNADLEIIHGGRSMPQPNKSPQSSPHRKAQGSESPKNKAGGRGPKQEQLGLIVEVRNQTLIEGPLVASKATIITSPRNQQLLKQTSNDSLAPLMRKNTPRNPKIVKIKPGDKKVSKDVTPENNNVSTKDLMSLIPSQKQFEEMNLKKFAFLQQRQRNSKMDLHDQKTLSIQRNASIKKIIAIQNGHEGVTDGQTTKSGGQGWMSHYFKTDKVSSGVQKQIQNSLRHRSSSPILEEEPESKPNLKNEAKNKANKHPHLSQWQQNDLSIQKLQGIMQAQGNDLSNESEYLRAKGVYKHGTNGQTRVLPTPGPQTPIMLSPGLRPQGEKRELQVSPQRVKLEQYRERMKGLSLNKSKSHSILSMQSKQRSSQLRSPQLKSPIRDESELDQELKSEQEKDERNSLVRLKRKLQQSASRQLLKNGSQESLTTNKSGLNLKSAKRMSDASNSQTPKNKIIITQDRGVSRTDHSNYDEKSLKSPLLKPRISALKAHGNININSRDHGAESELPSPFGVPEALRENKYHLGGYTPPQESGQVTPITIQRGSDLADEVRRINDDLPDNQRRNYNQREFTSAGKSQELKRKHDQSDSPLRTQKTTREKPAEQMGIVTLERFRNPKENQKHEEKPDRKNKKKRFELNVQEDYNSNDEGNATDYEEANIQAQNANRSSSLPPQPTSRILTAVQTKTVRNAPKKKKGKGKGSNITAKISTLSSRSNIRVREKKQDPSPNSKSRVSKSKFEKSPVKINIESPNANQSGLFAINVLDEPVASLPPADRQNMDLDLTPQASKSILQDDDYAFRLNARAEATFGFAAAQSQNPWRAKRLESGQPEETIEQYRGVAQPKLLLSKGESSIHELRITPEESTPNQPQVQHSGERLINSKGQVKTTKVIPALEELDQLHEEVVKESHKNKLSGALGSEKSTIQVSPSAHSPRMISPPNKDVQLIQIGVDFNKSKKSDRNLPSSVNPQVNIKTVKPNQKIQQMIANQSQTVLKLKSGENGSKYGNDQSKKTIALPPFLGEGATATFGPSTFDNRHRSRAQSMLGTHGMQLRAAGSRMPKMGLESTLQTKTSFGTIIPAKPIQDQAINLKINETNSRKIQSIQTIQDVRNQSTSKTLNRNDSQGSITSLLGNYGFIKLEDTNESSLPRRQAPSVTDRKIDKKIRREIEGLLQTRKLHESALESLRKKEYIKKKITQRRNSPKATDSQGYQMIETGQDETEGLLPKIVPFGVQTPIIQAQGSKIQIRRLSQMQDILRATPDRNQIKKLDLQRVKYQPLMSDKKAAGSNQFDKFSSISPRNFNVKENPNTYFAASVSSKFSHKNRFTNTDIEEYVENVSKALGATAKNANPIDYSGISVGGNPIGPHPILKKKRKQSMAVMPSQQEKEKAGTLRRTIDSQPQTENITVVSANEQTEVMDKPDSAINQVVFRGVGIQGVGIHGLDQSIYSQVDYISEIEEIAKFQTGIQKQQKVVRVVEAYSPFKGQRDDVAARLASISSQTQV